MMAEITTIEQASTLLGSDKGATPSEILISFDIMYKNLSKSVFTEDEINKAKLILLVPAVRKQVKEQRFFEIISPFSNTCNVCRGAGILFKFERKPVKVNCHICAGKGKIKTVTKIKCEKCKKTPGRHIIRWKEGGGINVTCKFCTDGFNDHVEVTKCSDCLGKGKIEKLVLSHEIKSTTPCNRCKQRGFIDPNPPIRKFISTPANPVIPQNIAMKIKEQFDKSDNPPAE